RKPCDHLSWLPARILAPCTHPGAIPGFIGPPAQSSSPQKLMALACLTHVPSARGHEGRGPMRGLFAAALSAALVVSSLAALPAQAQFNPRDAKQMCKDAVRARGATDTTGVNVDALGR